MQKELKALMPSLRKTKYTGDSFDAEQVASVGQALIDHVRHVVRSSGVSQSEIGRKLGMAQPSVWEFLEGGGLRSEKLAGLLLLFGYQIVPKED